MTLLGRYRHKKARKVLMLLAFQAFLGSYETYLWWRRRESNPRPQILHFWIYMLMLFISLT